jgi:type I restriction-modification system DNA methylase subunit
MDAAEYKHVVLGPIFVEYISNWLEERHAVPQSAKTRGNINTIRRRESLVISPK